MSNNSETVTISFPNHGWESQSIAGHAIEAIREYCAEGLKDCGEESIDIFADTIKGLTSNVDPVM